MIEDKLFLLSDLFSEQEYKYADEMLALGYKIVKHLQSGPAFVIHLLESSFDYAMLIESISGDCLSFLEAFITNASDDLTGNHIKKLLQLTGSLGEIKNRNPTTSILLEECLLLHCSNIPEGTVTAEFAARLKAVENHLKSLKEPGSKTIDFSVMIHKTANLCAFFINYSTICLKSLNSQDLAKVVETMNIAFPKSYCTNSLPFRVIVLGIIGILNSDFPLEERVIAELLVSSSKILHNLLYRAREMNSQLTDLEIDFEHENSEIDKKLFKTYKGKRKGSKADLLEELCEEVTFLKEIDEFKLFHAVLSKKEENYPGFFQKYLELFSEKHRKTYVLLVKHRRKEIGGINCIRRFVTVK